MKCSLSQSQAAQLWQASLRLPAQVRGIFFTEVDARLSRIVRQITDSDLQRAIVAALGDNPTVDVCNDGD